ncbi:hypothetical protein GCK32_010021 [Trichostrongylus colubriformis]|uniref:Uncharacterized protein n=1 Tax=Trichostrongylus colubriformis TaxID=6319 RepID=A0AAN8FTR2_TRICO
MEEESDASSELGGISSDREQVEGEELEQSRHEERVKPLPEMDEQDIAEMSMIAAQIQAGEEFDLTLETVDVDSSELLEETSPKSNQSRSSKSKKEVSPLYKSDSEAIEKFLEEGMNESMSVVEEAKMNMSLAESLLSEWGSPMPKRKRSVSEQRRTKDKTESVLLTSTPTDPQKPLKKFHFESAKSVAPPKRHISSSSSEDQHSPHRRRRVNISENAHARSRSKSFSKVVAESPTQSSKKSPIVSRNPLMSRNV